MDNAAANAIQKMNRASMMQVPFTRLSLREMKAVVSLIESLQADRRGLLVACEAAFALIQDTLAWSRNPRDVAVLKKLSDAMLMVKALKGGQ